MRSWKSSRPAPVPAQAAAAQAHVARPGEPAYLEIAQIQTAFGVDGEVRARILTDFPRRFARLKQVYLGEGFKPYPVEHAIVRAGEVFLKLGGVNSPEDAAKLRLQMVQVPTAEAMPLPKGAFYHYQIIGLSVESEDGTALGKVAEILATGGNDVYVVRGEKTELLLPAIADVVRHVDLEAGRITVSLLEGMEPAPLAAPTPKFVRPVQAKRPRGPKPAEKPVEAGAKPAAAALVKPAARAARAAGPAAKPAQPPKPAAPAVPVEPRGSEGENVAPLESAQKE